MYCMFFGGAFYGLWGHRRALRHMIPSFLRLAYVLSHGVIFTDQQDTFDWTNDWSWGSGLGGRGNQYMVFAGLDHAVYITPAYRCYCVTIGFCWIEMNVFRYIKIGTFMLPIVLTRAFGGISKIRFWTCFPVIIEIAQLHRITNCWMHKIMGVSRETTPDAAHQSQFISEACIQESKKGTIFKEDGKRWN